MASECSFVLFVEDRAHEEFLRALVSRISHENQVSASIRIGSARGGHGRTLAEFSTYQKQLIKGYQFLPDCFIAAIDANCSAFHQMRSEIEKRIEPSLKELTVIACPDPHIERWYMADLEAFHHVVGITPSLKQRKCDRDYYKALFAKAIRDAGHPPTLGGIEFAYELVEQMNLEKAGKNERSLKSLLDDLTAFLRRF